MHFLSSFVHDCLFILSIFSSLIANTKDPPSFLFDAIPEGPGRRVAGVLLWGHVAVSYAINSQALCSSIERTILQNYHHHHQQQQLSPRSSSLCSWMGSQREQAQARRWMVITFAVALSSYLVSNAIPFFKDLVALIGALTSVPLTLTLPAVLHRTFHRMGLWRPCYLSPGSIGLLVFSLLFLVVGLIGAISSTGEDWRNHGRPFSCH